MTDDKVFVDPSERAKIVFCDGNPPMATLTLQEACIAFGHLDAKQMDKAKIETVSGKTFGPKEIERLYRAP